MQALTKLLGVVFPPKPGRLDARLVVLDEPEEQGWAGNVREKEYRDAIDRHWKTVQNENQLGF